MTSLAGFLSKTYTRLIIGDFKRFEKSDNFKISASPIFVLISTNALSTVVVRSKILDFKHSIMEWHNGVEIPYEVSIECN